MLNDTIVGMVNALTQPTIPWWYAILALIGVLTLAQFLIKECGNLVYGLAYIWGLIKYLRNKFKKVDFEDK